MPFSTIQWYQILKLLSFILNIDMFFTEHIYIYKKPYKLLPYNECSIKQYWQEILRKLWKTFPIFFNKIIFNNNSDDYISSIQKIIFYFLWLKLIPRTALEFVQYAKKKKKIEIVTFLLGCTEEKCLSKV